MSMILVVGASGQLGSAVVKRALEKGKRVRALVRATSRYEHLKQEGVEIWIGDLRDAGSLKGACAGAGAVIATANSALPRVAGDGFAAVEGRGYANLIEACRLTGVGQFVFCSIFKRASYRDVPLAQNKWLIEKTLMGSGVPYTIFRCDAFMDTSFAMMGSELPARGVEAATVKRPFWMIDLMGRFGADVEKRGMINVIGSGRVRRSFICAEDVARFMVNAVGRVEALNRVFEVGGPEALSQMDVVAIFERVLGRKLVVRRTPVVALKMTAALLGIFSPAGANLLKLACNAASVKEVIDASEVASLFGVKLTSAEEFLRQKKRQN